MLSVSCKRALPRTVRNRRKFFPEKNLLRVPGGAVEIFSATKRTRAGSAALLEGFGRFSFCAVGGDYHSGSSSRRRSPRHSAAARPEEGGKNALFPLSSGRMGLGHMACVPFEKARWGRDGGLGGRTTRTPFLRKGWALSRSSDRMAAAGRARCDEGMGIDSRDEGFPFLPIFYEITTPPCCRPRGIFVSCRAVAQARRDSFFRLRRGPGESAAGALDTGAQVCQYCRQTEAPRQNIF